MPNLRQNDDGSLSIIGADGDELVRFGPKAEHAATTPAEATPAENKPAAPGPSSVQPHR